MIVDRLPYLFLVVVAGLSLATFFTSETLAAGQASTPCPHVLFDMSL